MKRSAVAAILFFVCSAAVTLVQAQEVDRALQLEKSGDAAGARMVLAKAVQSAPSDLGTLTQYAAFLERYGDPEARTVYRLLLTQSNKSGDRTHAVEATRRLVLLDLSAGDRTAAARDLDAYHAAGGEDWKAASVPSVRAAEREAKTIEIPGPMRSFGRMAAIAPDVRPEDVMPAVARNVVTNGYQASHSNDALEQTEYLKLVHRYLSQARELEKLAGASKVIKIEACESAETADLLKILGFRMRGG
jgi:hypothetical protein